MWHVVTYFKQPPGLRIVMIHFDYNECLAQSSIHFYTILAEIWKIITFVSGHQSWFCLAASNNIREKCSDYMNKSFFSKVFE